VLFFFSPQVQQDNGQYPLSFYMNSHLLFFFLVLWELTHFSIDPVDMICSHGFFFPTFPDSRWPLLFSLAPPQVFGTSPFAQFSPNSASPSPDEPFWSYALPSETGALFAAYHCLVATLTFFVLRFFALLLLEEYASRATF